MIGCDGESDKEKKISLNVYVHVGVSAWVHVYICVLSVLLYFKLSISDNSRYSDTMWFLKSVPQYQHQKSSS